MGLSNELPVKLGVSSTTATPTSFYSQRFWSFISPWWSPGLHCLSCSPVVPPSLSACKSGTTLSSRHRLTTCPLCPSCPSPPPPPVWMNVFSLTPWLSDFQIVWYSSSSGYFFVFKFVILLLVVQGGKCIYLCLHLGQKSKILYFTVPCPTTFHLPLALSHFCFKFYFLPLLAWFLTLMLIISPLSLKIICLSLRHSTISFFFLIIFLFSFHLY